MREIHSNPHLHLNPVGIIDDDRSKRKLLLSGVPVLGDRARIPMLVKDLQAEEIIIAMPSASGATIREIMDIARNTGVRVKILPSIYSGLKSSALSQLREVNMEDLLRREPVETNLNEISGYISGQTVLVTGAGGSIGSELCRQICSAAPSRLLMVTTARTTCLTSNRNCCRSTARPKSSPCCWI